jgi:hypothetical protein
MAEPTVETLRVLADDLGLAFTSDQLEAAARAHASLRPKLEQLRRYRFPYLEPIEPGHVRQWIENGGRTLDAPPEHGVTLVE